MLDSMNIFIYCGAEVWKYVAFKLKKQIEY